MKETPSLADSDPSSENAQPLPTPGEGDPALSLPTRWERLRTFFVGQAKRGTANVQAAEGIHPVSLPRGTDQHSPHHVRDEEAVGDLLLLNQRRGLLLVEMAHEDAASADDEVGEEPAQQ